MKKRGYEVALDSRSPSADLVITENGETLGTVCRKSQNALVTVTLIKNKQPNNKAAKLVQVMLDL